MKTRKEIAAEYDIDPRELYRLLKRHNIELPPGVICPKDVLRIYEALGDPELFKEREREEAKEKRKQQRATA